ncbi:cyclic nucleotide-binding domain protein [Ichthyophthirius multifiliis]|uniref:Cyclic nucleotide-binding domain protein n=1 Tax=Ichthyophthirius multifiliis TaxID=5932 RepID=G0QXP9_ICHMU|nr:cyclic nucleotide-binding domain protein [Ichthyophthirius multifiliis]EGR29986.1 cyclic nucleotide-binding domain protein [Ichthyophthirius multifiliis]|eukprot:XP_004031222.1 cyclic nucleotide-binding domain protein [Ichthyophthirius multifiliis]
MIDVMKKKQKLKKKNSLSKTQFPILGSFKIIKKFLKINQFQISSLEKFIINCNNFVQQYFIKEITEKHIIQQQKVNFLQKIIIDFIKNQGEVWCLIEQQEQNNIDNKTIKQSLNNYNQDQSEDQFVNNFFQNQKIAQIYKQWQAFGEIALYTEAKRTATMICKSDTHLIVISKNGFNKIIGELCRQKILEKINFIKQYWFFSQIPNNKIMSILMYFKIENIQKEKYLYKEGEQIKDIYLLKEGEVELTKKLENQNNIIQNKIYDEQLIEQKLAKAYQKLQNTLRISVLSQNSYFGLEELINKKQFRDSSAQCISTQAIIYRLPLQILQVIFFPFKLLN